MVSDPSEYRRRRIDRLEFKCVACGKHQMKSIAMLQDSPICFFCCPKESKGQLEVFDFVKTLVADAVSSDRTVISPKELDIWIPSKKLGIEYNGLYWHSTAVLKDTKYHQKKQDDCSAAGINLLSVYEDEWRDKRLIVEGMIRHRLGMSVKTWDARKLDVVSLSLTESRDFFNANHLEGHVSSSVVFGLRDKASGQVVAAMSLRRPFHKKYRGQLEVGRCCTLVGHSVRGWLGRLTSEARKHARSLGVTSLMTYVDSRVGPGSGYAAAGWSVVNRGKSPRFWWTDFENRFNRFKYRADKSKGLTQEQVAAAAGVVTIHGCPNATFSLPV